MNIDWLTLYIWNRSIEQCEPMSGPLADCLVEIDDWLRASARSPGRVGLVRVATDGMSIVVGRGRSEVVSADRVHAMMTLPPEPRTFNLVVHYTDHKG